LGGRRGKEGPIIIKEINAADQMADAWQAQMSELTKPGKVGSGGAAVCHLFNIIYFSGY
jgi:hypothetical protein